MIKNKIIVFLFLSIFSIQFSLPSFAMQGDDEDIPLSQVPIKLKENKDRIKKLEKELEDIKKEKEEYKKVEIIINKNKELEVDLKEADYLIELLLNDEATLTTYSFIKAVYNKKSEKKLNKLFQKANNRQDITNIIVDGHTKFRGQAPEAHRKVLKLTGLLNSMTITDDYPTITYGEVSIQRTPSKKLIKAEKFAEKISKRSQDQDPNNNNSTEDKIKNETIEQDIEKIEKKFENIDISIATIQSNHIELNLKKDDKK